MIDPTNNDIGRGIVFYGKWGDQLLPAKGRLVGFDAEQVFAQFGDEDSNVIAFLRVDLDWTEPEKTALAPVVEEPVATASADEPLLPFGGAA